MIYPQTMLTVADNTGAKKIMCIRVLGGNRKYGKIGDTIIGVVKEALPNMPIKKSDVVRAVIVRTSSGVNCVLRPNSYATVVSGFKFGLPNF